MNTLKTSFSKKIWFLMGMLGLFLVQDKLQELWEPFGYFDEIFGLTLIPAFLVRFFQKRLRPEKKDFWILGLLGVFFLCGWGGWLVYRYQPLKQAVMDAYVNVKFFLTLGAAWLIFDDDFTDFAGMKDRMWNILNFITVELFLLCLCNLVLDLFPYDMRGPLRAIKLYYSTYTVLVGVCALLAAIYLWYYNIHGKKIIPYLAMLCFIMYCTRRVKGFGAIAVIFTVYLFVLMGKEVKLSRRLKIGAVAVIAIAAVAGLYQLFSYYIAMGIGSARAMLTLASPFCAWDHFPTGSGWATFGSAFSGEPYSPVYGKYLLRGIWGLGPGDDPSFLSDTYWPMILGQCGFFGFAALVAGLALMTRRLLGYLKEDRGASASVMFVLLYLLISSTSESTLANPIAIPLAFWIGFLVAERRAGVRKG